jgi:hypothetical protein
MYGGGMAEGGGLMQYLTRREAQKKAVEALNSITGYMNRKRREIAGRGTGAERGNVLEELIAPGYDFVRGLLSKESIEDARKLDATGFKEYYEYIGELVTGLDLGEKHYFTGMEIVTGENLEAAINGTGRISRKVEYLKGFHSGELGGLSYRSKGLVMEEIEKGTGIRREEKEKQIRKILESMSIEEAERFMTVPGRGQYRIIWDVYSRMRQDSPGVNNPGTYIDPDGKFDVVGIYDKGNGSLSIVLVGENTSHTARTIDTVPAGGRVQNRTEPVMGTMPGGRSIGESSEYYFPSELPNGHYELDKSRRFEEGSPKYNLLGPAFVPIKTEQEVSVYGTEMPSPNLETGLYEPTGTQSDVGYGVHYAPGSTWGCVGIRTPEDAVKFADWVDEAINSGGKASLDIW